MPHRCNEERIQIITGIKTSMAALDVALPRFANGSQTRANRDILISHLETDIETIDINLLLAQFNAVCDAVAIECSPRDDFIPRSLRQKRQLVPQRPPTKRPLNAPIRKHC